MPTLIDIENLTVNYDHIEALRDLSLTVEKGDFIAIVGPNGGGKSTLIKSILGLVKPKSGCINYMCNSKGERIVKVGYVPQISAINNHYPITVEEAVLTATLPDKAKLFHRYKKVDHDAVYEVLAQVGLENHIYRQIDELSGGEFKKVLIARSLLTNPDVLLLDEPNAMVDQRSQKQILELLKELSKTVTIMIVTHKLNDVRGYATKQYWVEKTISPVSEKFNRELLNV